MKWKPKKGEKYFFIFDKNIFSAYWKNGIFDFSHFTQNNCFKTKKEINSKKIGFYDTNHIKNGNQLTMKLCT